ncbi:MAG: helix-turn-helix domain-containing protein [Acidobacteriota bacterium]
MADDPSIAPEPPSLAYFTIRDVAQLKALADPLRMRILEVFCVGPATTKQVAEKLGEKTTKLYHHVETLEKAGLIELHATRPNRGTLEKYFLGVARAFRVDDELLLSDPDAGGWTKMGSELLSRGAEDIRALEGRDLEGVLPMIAQLKASVPRSRLEWLQGELERLIDQLGAESEERKATEDADECADAVEFQLILALYPTPVPDS